MACEGAVEQRQAQVSEGIAQALSEAGGEGQGHGPTPAPSGFHGASRGKGLNTQGS